MTRRCQRPGCSEPAGVSFRFDAGRRLVELIPGISDVGPQAGVLCRRHGDAMVLPKGWVLDDQRDLTPRLFAVERPPEPAHERPTRSKRRRSSPSLVDTADPSTHLFVVPEPGADQAVANEVTVADVAGNHPDASPDETQAMPWIPIFDKDDDLGGLLDATTPMLRRAFGLDERRQNR